MRIRGPSGVARSLRNFGPRLSAIGEPPKFPIASVYEKRMKFDFGETVEAPAFVAEPPADGRQSAATSASAAERFSVAPARAAVRANDAFRLFRERCAVTLRLRESFWESCHSRAGR